MLVGRFSISILLVALAVGSVGPASATEPGARRPNVLLLMADELRADALGYAGNPIVETPNLDALAAESVRFSAAYTAAPVCAPARASLLTGRYPHAHGVRGNDDSLHADEVTLPEILSRYGYATAMIGKLHLQREHAGQRLFDWISAHTNWRFRSGFFDEEVLTRNGFNRDYQAFVEENTQLPYRGFRFYERTKVDTGDENLWIATHALPARLSEEAWIAGKAIEFLKRREEDDTPWFLFVSMSKPHTPYVIPPPYANLYAADEMPLPATFEPGAARQSSARGRTGISDVQILREVIAHYYGAVTMVDDEMGRVLRSLERRGFADDTLVVFTSDHGNMLGERNLLFKDVMYEGSARVPLLVRLPSGREWRTIQFATEGPLDQTSLVPTILDLAGIPIPESVHGRSLVIAPDRSRGAGEAMAFAELHDTMVVARGFKLIRPVADASPTRPRELYDLAADPDEQHDLYGLPEALPIQRALESALADWSARTAD